MKGSSSSSMSSASAAVAMANSAIENARRAAASSRRSRQAIGTSSSGNYKSPTNLAASKSSSGGDFTDSGNFDLKSNDNAYHVIATLVTDRLLPKLEANSSYYTLTREDTAFFQKMLPYSVRRKFVDALRYRLQSIKRGDSRVTNNTLIKLTKQCQVLGLDRENTNALLDLSNNTGVRYSVKRENENRDLPIFSSYDFQDRPYAHANDYMAVTQQPSIYGGASGDNGLPYGISSSMAYQNHDGYVPSVTQDWEATAESLARQQIMAEIDETKFLMQGSATPEAKGFWQKHLNELNERLVALNVDDQKYSLDKDQTRGGVGFGSGITPAIKYDVRPQIENYGLSGNQATINYEMDQSPAASPIIGNRRGGLSTCEVVAPSDLPGGYMFEAQLGSKKFLATVPSGGVIKGQQFVSTMKELEMIEIPVTMGGWKDDLCDCFDIGICHPLLLNGIFFPCIALGQIMTRTGLDWQAQPANKFVSSLSCTNMTVVFFFWIAMNASAALMFVVRWQRGQDLEVDFYAPIVALNVLFLFYLLKLVKNTRAVIRDKYQIPENTCIGCEDCMCATFCMSCTICQMGRHTADFDTYSGTCCSSTGLPEQVELAPSAFFEDGYRNFTSS